MTSHTNPTVNGEVRAGLVPPSRWSEVPTDHSAAAGPLPRSGAPEVGLPDTASADGPETFFDGKIFDPSAPEAYARSFDLKNILG